MINKIYTYDDWLNGKVVLVYSRLEYNRKEISEPIIVSWDNFNLIDRNNIQKNQELIFQALLNEKFESLKADFENKFSLSKSKIDLVNTILRRLNEVIKGRLRCNNHYCVSSDGNLTLDINYYDEIKWYIKHFYIGGLRYDFSNVQSQKSPYNNHLEVMPEIFVEAIYKMIDCLNTAKMEILQGKGKSTFLNTNDNQIIKSEDENPFPEIFSSKEAYNFFLDLEKNTFNDKYKKASYSFIFLKMKHDKLNYPIKSYVTQREFCEFLAKNRNIDIFPYKLKRINPKNKQAPFEECLKRYNASLTQ